eukprot:TRINITY_DN109701_c0_g1_i1.p1 TRINITY_DN109701_c0_g1~~TRINITY_DN109701_c0_g1_i1.p1  ORF type:complete len:424 (+),score=42.25 TRINITY_DN109701_c0_g1_i1:85-1356(+)
MSGLLPGTRHNYQTVPPNGTQGACCDDFILSGGGENGEWKYVGPGRGAFARQEDIAYVGAGRGDFDIERRGYGIRALCGLVVCILALLVVILDLWYTQYLFKPRETQPGPRYECLVGQGVDRRFDEEMALSWTGPHKIWCCENIGVACTTTPPPTTEEPTTPSPTTTPQATTWILVPVPAEHSPFMGHPAILPVAQPGEMPAVAHYHLRTGPHFDCSSPPTSWQPGQSEWCCQHESIGCPTQAPVEYNCAPVAGNDPALWLSTKAAWCCENYGSGCPTTTPVPSFIPLDQARAAAAASIAGAAENAVTATSAPDETSSGEQLSCTGEPGTWDEVRKNWCCANEGKGCTTALPSSAEQYDCNAGYTDWQQLWSQPHQAWCCQMHKRGCPGQHTTYECLSGEDSWPEEQRTWCCQHHGKGCSTAS